jgi:hypothetical protein
LSGYRSLRRKRRIEQDQRIWAGTDKLNRIRRTEKEQRN